MQTIDPAGAASSALYTPAVPIQTTPSQVGAVVERPVVESNDNQPTNDSTTRSVDSESRLGRFIDTTA